MTGIKKRLGSLLGPRGYNATGAAEDQQTIASYIAARIGANPVSEALDDVIDAQTTPVRSRANAAHALAQNTSSRVDALEVVTDITPGNVDDATIALHVGQPASLARDTVARVVLDVPTNLFDASEFTDGYYYQAGSGVPVESSSQGISGWIPVIAGQPYTYTSQRAAPFTRLTYFDGDREFVDSFDGLAQETITRTAPSGVAWVRVTLPRVNVETFQMNHGSSVLPYEPGGKPKLKQDYLPELEFPDLELSDGSVTPDKTSFFEVSENLVDLRTASRGYWYAAGDGTLLENENNKFWVTDWVRVDPETTYSTSEILRVTWFDESREFLHSDDGGATTHNVFVSPVGAAWARLTINNVAIQDARMNKGETLLPWKPGGATLAPQYIPDMSDTCLGVKKTLLIADTSGLAEPYTAPVIEAPSDLMTTTTDDVYGWYDDLVAAHPDYVTKTDLGPSSDSAYRVYAYSFRPEPVPDETYEVPLPVALIVSGMHGYEKTAVHHTWRLAKALCEEWEDHPALDAMRWNIEVLIVPVAVPHGYDHGIRHNANGVDINRNFEVSWTSGTEGTSTYGGTAPLTEPEAIAVNALMQEIKDRAVFGVDFHNMSTQPEMPERMIWVPSSRESGLSDFTLALGKRLISRVSRKWRTEHPWITNDATYFGYADKTNVGGTTSLQMVHHGFPGSTFEVSRRQYLDGGTGENRETRAMTLGYDAFVNYMAMGIKAGIDLKNRN